MNRIPNDRGGTAAKKPRFRTFLSSNPILRKLDDVHEYTDTNASSYGGIALKTVYFLLFSIVGIVLQIIFAAQLHTGELTELTFYKSFHVSMYTGEIIALIAAVLLGVVFQLLANFVRGTTPVTGALYSVTQGYFISFLIFKVLQGREYIGLLALAITMVIILVMALLYVKGIIRVTKKFRMVMMTLLFTSIGISVLMFIFSFIPFTQPLVQAIRGNIVLSIGFSIIFIIIAALFLVSDFSTIDHVVSDQLPKKYEWRAAFGLSFTVLWLYLKVLDLILKIIGNNQKS